MHPMTGSRFLGKATGVPFVRRSMHVGLGMEYEASDPRVILATPDLVVGRGEPGINTVERSTQAVAPRCRMTDRGQPAGVLDRGSPPGHLEVTRADDPPLPHPMAPIDRASNCWSNHRAHSIGSYAFRRNCACI